MSLVSPFYQRQDLLSFDATNALQSESLRSQEAMAMNPAMPMINIGDFYTETRNNGVNVPKVYIAKPADFKGYTPIGTNKWMF